MRTNVFRNLIWQDIKNHKFSAAAIVAFGGISVMLFTLSLILFCNLLGAIELLMNTAKTPDFLQMHAGEVSEEAIKEFAAGTSMAQQYQISRFLNLENKEIYLGEHCLVDSTQDNGLCVQNPSFDFLLDESNEKPKVSAGEVYVPICYQQQYGLGVGDFMQIGQEKLTIGGFVRDAQMNSMMASSKRFLVCAEDYERLRPAGSEEYLIEFLLEEGADSGAFATAYANAGLPSNGPTITRGLIKMLNALSDGMMIMIILFVSVLVFLISAVCVRFILLTRMENEKKEIGMLRAFGVDKKEVRRLYFGKYAAIACVGAVLGMIAAWLLAPCLSRKMQELYGTTAKPWQTLLFSIIGAAGVTGCMLLFIRGILRRLERITALSAMLGGQEKAGGGQKGYLIVIAAVCTFLMVIPTNLHHTMASPKFVTYMGIGEGELRIDVRQGANIAQLTEELLGQLEQDTAVEKKVLLQTCMQKVVTENGNENLLTEAGDHTVFPVSYSAGRAPQKEGEIALSALEAKELSAENGEKLTLVLDGEKKEYFICGIYSDITNGGKTAKIYGEQSREDVMWNVLYLSLKEGEDRQKWVEQMREWASDAVQNGGENPASIKVVEILDYVQATYGQTLEQIHMASIVTDLSACMILLLVVMLFLKLLVAKKRYAISLEKALGIPGKDIMRRYFVQGVCCAAIGAAVGIVLGVFLGEKLCAAALCSFGADGFRFLLNPMDILVWIPAAALLTSVCAVLLGIRDIKAVRAYECCRVRE